LVTKATFYVNLPYYTFEREGAIVTRPDQQIGAHWIKLMLLSLWKNGAIMIRT